MLLSHDAFGGGCEHDERVQRTPGFQARARASKSDREETCGCFYSTPAIDCRCALNRRSSRSDVELSKKKLRTSKSTQRAHSTSHRAAVASIAAVVLKWGSY
jgi:hypothetical protein